MSGLLCGLSPDCSDEILLFVPDYDKRRPSPSYLKKEKDPMSNLNINKDCPPGCGCDNPWAFLS